MSHSFVHNYLHVVFNTKDRQKLIPKEMQPKLWAYTAGIARNHDFLVVANGGMEDQAHLLILLPAVLSLSKAIGLVKANSSGWMNEHRPGFAWQEGYGAFSVSESNKSKVVRYIEEQEKTSSKNHIRRRVHQPSQEAPHRIRSEICLRIVSPLRGSDLFISSPRPAGLG